MKIINLIYALSILLMLSACSGSGPVAPTATPIDIGALQTAAVETIVANFTQTAAAVQPTQTSTQTVTPQPAQPTETATPTLVLSPTVALCDNSVFISDASVPDNTEMTAGQVFVKTWKVKNTGSCSWGPGYQIIHAYGEKLGGLPTVLTQEVPPGAEVEISINLKAPLKAGTYGGYFRLANNNGLPFGTIFTVIIVVP